MADKQVFKIGNKIALFTEPPDKKRPKGAGRLSKTTIWVEGADFYGDSITKGPAQSNLVTNGRKRKRTGRSNQSSDDTPYLILGFDTEFVAPKPRTKSQIKNGIVSDATLARNKVLSYQFAAIGPAGERWDGIVCTKLRKKSNPERIKFAEFIVFALGSGLRSKAIPRIPTTIYLAAHFSRADFTAFKDFKDMTSVISNIRNTFSSTDKPFEIEINVGDAAPIALKVFLRDTMLLTPQASKNLKAVGELVGSPKVILDSDPKKEQKLKERMDELRRNNWDLFRKYAIHDALICAEYLKRIALKQLEVNGSRKIPVTLTGIGVQLLLNLWAERGGRNIHHEILGKEPVTEKTFSKRDGYYKKQTRLVPLEEVHWFQKFAIECFHGGRSEQYWFGPSYEANWSDYDLSSAYPTAMSLICFPKWREVFTTQEVDDFSSNTLGLACVDFVFPNNVRYPTLPMRTANGILFPKTGRSYCAAPEIALAKQLGAELEIRLGIVVPTNNDDPVFLSFIKKALDERKKSPKGSLESNFWKEIANSLYGKTAQGIQQRRVFDMRDGEMKVLPESQITNPYFAAFITSFVRATMGEIMNKLPTTRMVFSCTTDGFLTDASQAEIDRATSGPLSRIYSKQRKLLTNDDSVLEIKHRAKRLLGWRARGQATITPAVAISPDDKTAAMPLAKGGIRLVDHYENDQLENEAILELFWNRTSKTRIPVESLSGIRDMIEMDIDSIPIIRNKKLNMEYDWKRRPFDVKESKKFRHISFSTTAWDSYEQFRTLRDVNENDETPPIKKIKDLRAFFASIETTLSVEAKHRSKARKVNRALNLLMWSLSYAWYYDRSRLGRVPKKLSASGFANLLTRAGCKASRYDIENAKKRRNKVFVPNLVPATKETIEVLDRLKRRLRGLKPGDFLATSTPTYWLVFNEGGTTCNFLKRLS